MTQLDDPRSQLATDWQTINAAARPADAPTTIKKTPDYVSAEQAADFTKREVATAQADLTCRKAYNTTEQQVRFEYETKFVADHKADLERYRDALGG